jgi:hypothetical protein
MKITNETVCILQCDCLNSLTKGTPAVPLIPTNRIIRFVIVATELKGYCDSTIDIRSSGIDDTAKQAKQEFVQAQRKYSPRQSIPIIYLWIS